MGTRAGYCVSVLRAMITGWALCGGALLAGLVLVNVWTVLGRLIGRPFAGDFELTQMCVAAAVFMFLPYCQLHRQNVTADLFTAGMGRGMRRALDGLGSIAALGFAALLLWRMYFGLLDQKNYNLSTTILQIPVWWAYVPILLSLALLVSAAMLSLIDDIRGMS